MDILGTNLAQKKNNEYFSSIQKHVINYEKFLSHFTKGNYNNLPLILEYLVEILSSLTGLKKED